MKKNIVLSTIIAFAAALSLEAAYQYSGKGNEVYLTFTSETTVAFDVSRSGKDKDHENFIDRGEGIADYGWYNLDNNEEFGSFANGATATFNENDRIGLYVNDADGNIFRSTKQGGEPGVGTDLIWGKANEIDGSIALYGGNKGSNGTHEYYVFKVNNANANGKTPSGQPLPGIIATLVVGGGAIVYLKKRKKLIDSK